MDPSPKRRRVSRYQLPEPRARDPSPEPYISVCSRMQVSQLIRIAIDLGLLHTAPPPEPPALRPSLRELCQADPPPMTEKSSPSTD